jgi:hypothetical protein
MATARRSKAATPKVPPIVYAEASPRSLAGTSLFAPTAPVTSETVRRFHSEEDVTAEAVARRPSTRAASRARSIPTGRCPTCAGWSGSRRPPFT